MVLLAGQTIGRFKLESEIGRGSFSTVWKARDLTLLRDVAIKVPNAELEPSLTERFLREARRVAQLQHRGIVLVHDADIDRETSTPFIVLELVEGVTLREWAAFVDLDSRAIAELVSQIALAVHHAHLAGIIHRDLKPANVLVSLSGEIHVADFGLARAAGIDATIETSTIGTIAYMSPEQASLIPEPVTARSDVYSLGVILFELLAKTNPIDATSPSDYLAKLGTGMRQDLRILCPHISKDLTVICEKSLEQYPKHRFGSAREMADELQRFARGEMIVSRPLTQLERIRRAIARNPWLAARNTIAVGMLLMAMVFGVYYRLQSQQAFQNQRKQAVIALRDADAERVPNALEELLPFHSPILQSELRELFSHSNTKVALHASYGLAQMKAIPIEQLVQFVPQLPADEVPNLIAALATNSEESRVQLKRHMDLVLPKHLGEKARYAIALAHVGDRSYVREMAELDADPVDRTLLIDLWPRFHGNVSDLIAWSKSEEHTTLVSVIVQALESIDKENLLGNRRKEIDRALVWLFQNHTDGAVHSYARRALEMRGVELPNDGKPTIPNGFWRDYPNGISMVAVSMPSGSPALSKTRRLWFSAAEIPVHLYKQFETTFEARVEEKYDRMKLDPEHAVRFVTGNHMIQFCNWLSEQQNRACCYTSIESGDETGSGWTLDKERNGYRLPTVEEFQYANLAMSTQGFFFGDLDSDLPRYANVTNQSTATPRMRFAPNGFGLFDTLGNVAEACHLADNVKEIALVGGGFVATPGECRGNVKPRKNLSVESVHLGFRVVCLDE